ncbi:tail fiber protein [Yersinia enterocolitica]|nr:tail fiber protein [Yersinia enterocolitica]
MSKIRVEILSTPDDAVSVKLRDLGQALFSSVIGASRNLRISVPVAAPIANFSADQLIVGTQFNGVKYSLTALNLSINLATVGVGGMDTGAAPISGFVAIYVIYNPATLATALLAVNTTSAKVSEVYSGTSMPIGFTASALVSVWGTSASLFKVGYQTERHVMTVTTPIYTSSAGSTAINTLSIATLVPKNCKDVDLYATAVQSAGGQGIELFLMSSSNEVGKTTVNATASSGTVAGNKVVTLPVINEQSIAYAMSNTNAGSYSISIRGYSI